jgi:hypothetical protein
MTKRLSATHSHNIHFRMYLCCLWPTRNVLQFIACQRGILYSPPSPTRVEYTAAICSQFLWRWVYYPTHAIKSILRISQCGIDQRLVCADNGSLLDENINSIHKSNFGNAVRKLYMTMFTFLHQNVHQHNNTRLAQNFFVACERQCKIMRNFGKN